jgi:hypothetical protein
MQRWLNLNAICERLQTTPPHIQFLVKNGFLESIPGTKKQGARYLDPTDKYAERLRVTEIIYARKNPVTLEGDISEKALFTKNEIAAITGWSHLYTVKYLHQHKVPAIKCGNQKTGLCLYTAKTVREILWRRSGRRLSPQRAPFLIEELVAFFRKMPEDDIPTDVQLEQDDRLRKKMERMLKLPSPQKEQALQDLMAKTVLARQVALVHSHI